MMRGLACALAALWLAGAAAAAAQSGPLIPRPPGVVEVGRPYQPSVLPPLPPPPVPEGRWVPERRVFSPELGREVVVPPHFERRITEQTYQVPTLPVAGPKGENPTHIPGGERPPADLRQGP
jgi:hypothetical protein